MLPMPFAPSRSLASVASRAVGLFAGIVVAVVPALAAADTGAPVAQAAQAAQAPQDDAPDVNAPPGDGYADTDPSALTDFRQTLDPHGQWVQDPTYGTVWVPDSNEVGPDFAPYQTAGQWEVADSGDWMWQSDYDWGYVPFHYGRWVWAGAYWGWIPGRTYAPAWVTWRVGDGGYLGWAPLPPTWYWADGYPVGLGTVPWAAYCFVPTGAVFYPNVGGYVVREHGLVQAAGASTRPYHPATPTVGAHPAVGSHSPQRMSPTFAEAHVPPSAIPGNRFAADSRAMALSTKSGTTAMQHAPTRTAAGRSQNLARYSAGAAAQRRPDAWHNSYDRATVSRQAEAPAYRGSTYRAAPVYRTAPTFRTVPSGYHGAPSYYAPAARPSASHSAPAPAYHPSYSHSSGGYHGGGGHRR
jgi:hypothetical protein